MSFPWQGEKQDYYLPMINFDTVTNGIYRSGFPLKRNLPFIHKLGIKTILFIEPDQESKPYLIDMQEYCSKNGINYIYIPFDVGAYPNNPEEVNRSLEMIFEILLDRRNYPILINCLKGQESGFHFTGTLVACIRRLQQWSMSSIFTEFAHFEKKMRVYDMLVVELFKINLNASPEYLPDWLTVEEYENMRVLLANDSTVN